MAIAYSAWHYNVYLRRKLIGTAEKDKDSAGRETGYSFTPEGSYPMESFSVTGHGNLGRDKIRARIREKEGGYTRDEHIDFRAIRYEMTFGGRIIGNTEKQVTKAGDPIEFVFTPSSPDLVSCRARNMLLLKWEIKKHL